MLTCTNCGNEVTQLYKKYPSGLLKPDVCVSCGLVLDKYMEYDTTLVLIDLVLLKVSVYRHLLLNTSHTKICMRLLVLVILSSAYGYWIDQKDSLSESELTRDLEWSFYLTCLTCIQNFIGFTVLLASSFSLVNYVKPKSSFSLRRLLEAIVIGQCTQFLKLIAIVWGQQSNAIYMGLLTGYLIASTTQGCIVVSGQGRLMPIALVLFAYLAMQYAFMAR